jgi:two-component system sensor histidine kinase/response regulator
MKALVVEDDPIASRTMLKALESSGFEVKCVSTGLEALEAFQKENFPVMILDWMLPGMDGLEVCRKIRSLPHGHDVFILVNTIRCEKEDLLEVLNAGANDYLPKNDKLSALDIRFQVARSQVMELQRRKNAETELNAVNKELEAFAYSVSHDLRAPLRTIHGFSRLLQESHAKLLDEEGKKFLNLISSASLKMNDMIENLLTFSSSVRAEIKIDHLEMQELVDGIIEELKTVWPSSNSKWKVDKLNSAHGDAALLRHVWTNLLSNAIKYTEGRPDPKIHIGSEVNKRENKVVYFVKDNGAGFDMKDSSRLFKVFQRLPSNTHVEGHGIGLALAQRVVHRHRGEIWAEGIVNKGATFYFSLPIRSGH